jgi:hypothetical protein
LGHQLNPRSVAWAQRNERSKVINVSRSEWAAKWWSIVCPSEVRVNGIRGGTRH